MTLRYIPDQMVFVTDAFEVVHDTVARVVTHPVGHSVPAIRQDMVAVVVTSSRGLTRAIGTTNAYIDTTLRMVIDCDDRNELVKYWELAQKHETNPDYTGHDAEIAYHAHAEVEARPLHKHGVNSLGQAIERWHAFAEFFGYEPRIADLPHYMERD